MIHCGYTVPVDKIKPPHKEAGQLSVQDMFALFSHQKQKMFAEAPEDKHSYSHVPELVPPFYNLILRTYNFFFTAHQCGKGYKTIWS